MHAYRYDMLIRLAYKLLEGSLATCKYGIVLHRGLLLEYTLRLLIKISFDISFRLSLINIIFSTGYIYSG